MKDRKWALGLSVLFLVLLFLLGNFIHSYLKIHNMVSDVAGVSLENKSARHHIVMISQELDNPYWRTIESAVTKAAERYNMEVEYIGPFRLNPSEQSKLLEKTIAAKVDGIFVQGIEGSEYASLIDKSVARKIPVLTVDTDVPDSKRITYVGTDNRAAGKRLGELVVQAAAGLPADIGIIIGGIEAGSQKQRLDGFLEAIRSHENLRIAKTGVSNISRIQAGQVAEAILRERKDIRIMVGLSALDGIGIVQAVKTVGLQDRIKIFGFDDLDETRRAIANGEMEAAVIQQPSEMGRRLVENLHAHFEGSSPPDMDLTGFQVLSRADAGGSVAP